MAELPPRVRPRSRFSDFPAGRRCLIININVITIIKLDNNNIIND